MTPEEELLELARKAWPRTLPSKIEVELGENTALVWRDGVPNVRVVNHPRAHEAVRAALLAMGEP